MDIQKISPELKPYYQFLPAIPFHNPSLRFLINAALKLSGKKRKAPGVTINQHSLGSAILRVYRPLNGPVKGGLLWMHGGGFIVGSASQDDRICVKYAHDLNIVVVSIEYRLAPENPFPAALDDSLAAWNWLNKNSPLLSIPQEKLILGGMSAGGGLAACLAQKIFDSGGNQPAAQILVYPMLDDRTAADRTLDLEVHPLWNNINNRGGWKAYLGQDPGMDEVPDYAVAARRENLTGLPPCWIGVGDIDLFYNENRHYAERLEAAGVPCEFHQVPMAPHGFQVVAPDSEISVAFSRRIYSFLSRILDSGSA